MITLTTRTQFNKSFVLLQGHLSMHGICEAAREQLFLEVYVLEAGKVETRNGLNNADNFNYDG